MPDNVIQSYENFKKAFSKLKEFVDTDKGRIHYRIREIYRIFW